MPGVSEKNDLIILRTHQTYNAVAGSLRLMCNDGHSLAHQSIHQSRFPDIGSPDDIDEARFVFFAQIEAY